MSAVTITTAGPDMVRWRVGQSLHIDSSREAVEQWIEDAQTRGYLNVDGHHLTTGDLMTLRAAMDDAAWTIALEKRTDRADQWNENFR